MRCTNLKAVSIFSAALGALFLSVTVRADIQLTQLANAGVILTDGQARIMIDGMVVEPYAVYGGLPESAVADFLAASGDFAGIDVALVSHRHHEHNQPEFACRFMQASTSTELFASEQVVGLLREFCRDFTVGSPRVHTIDPQPGRPEVIERAGVRVTVFPLSHGKRKYARIQHYAHLVEIGGMKVLHVGDAALDPAAFETAGLTGLAPDVALIPLRFFQPGPGAALIERYLDAPLKIAVHVPPAEVEDVRTYMTEFFPSVQILDKPMEQLRFSAARPTPEPEAQ